MRDFRSATAVMALLLALTAGAGTFSPTPATALTCGDIPDLTTLFFQKHIRFDRLTDSIKERTVETYLRRVDPQRVLFLDQDVARLEESLMAVFHETRAGDCTRLRQLQQELIARNREVEGFVRGYVGREDYALDESVELVLDPEKRGTPANATERDALLRTLVHFQISNYLASDASLDEARERLIHRYELRTKRASEVTRDDLYAGFLDAFASSLDPHSSYLSPDVLEDFQIQMQLSLEGIGVALSERDGYAVVEQIIPGGAADRLDVLEPKDKIIAVAEEGKDAVDIIDMALRDVVRLIRGKKGTRVHLTVLRQQDKTERFHVAILRDTIDLEQQAAKLRFEEVDRKDGKDPLKLAVIELPSFYGDRDPTKRKGSRDVKRLLDQVKAEGADGLLLDLSRNGGGLLEDAVRISGFFIREGGIVAVREENRLRSRVHEDPDDGILYDGPMVVLTSRVSASASEILAGAMKDYQRAVVVGDDHTFGKGTVQSVFPLGPKRGALKVTTGLFFRPGGTSTQHGGVNSDVILPSLFATDSFGERNQPHSLPGESIDPFLGKAANGGQKRWTPVTGDVVRKLEQLSAERVKDDEFFQKVNEQLAERAEDDGIVQLAEIIAEREEAKNDGDEADGMALPGEETAATATPKAQDDDEEPGPHVEEALQILADLVSLQS